MRVGTGSCVAIALTWAMPSVAAAQAGLPAGTAPPAEGAARPARPAPEPEKRICRTEVVTGSLVQKRKVCTTVAERNAAARAAQGTLQGMTGVGCLGGEGC